MLAVIGVLMILTGILLAAKCAPFAGYDFKACACSWLLLIGCVNVLASFVVWVFN